MSDDNDKKEASEEATDVEVTAEVKTDEPVAPEPPPPAAEKPVAVSEKAEAPPRRGGFIAWLALLLVIALAGGSAWVVMEAQRRAEALAARVNVLESSAGREDSELEQSLSAVGQQLENRLMESQPGGKQPEQLILAVDARLAGGVLLRLVGLISGLGVSRVCLKVQRRSRIPVLLVRDEEEGG